MARKLALSRLEAEVLDQISEAGAEDVTVVLNTVTALPSEAPESRLKIFEQALRRLYELQLVDLVAADRPGYPPVLSEQVEEALRLSNWIRWEANGGYWTRASKAAENIAIALKR
jgi:hypothetical protein